MTIQRKLNWKPQKPDSRDFTMAHLKARRPLMMTLPKAVNLRQWCSAVFDQGELGSCTANAWAGLLQYNEIKNGRGGKLYYDMSRLFIYYNERVIGKYPLDQDTGAELRNGADAIAKWGACIEKEWPYKINSFKQKPSVQCYKDALANVIHGYYALNTFNDLKVALANGHPFVFGFQVYDSFMSDAVANTGVVSMPNLQTESVQGGHAVMAVGYDDTQKRFLVRNSWGKKWGLKGNLAGYFTMPYDYLANSNLSSDFWTCDKEI